MRSNKLLDFKINKIVRSVLNEENKINSKKEIKKPKCIPENVIPLEEIVGRSDEYSKYTPGITKRSMGVNSMVDT